MLKVKQRIENDNVKELKEYRIKYNLKTISYKADKP